MTRPTRLSALPLCLVLAACGGGGGGGSDTPDPVTTPEPETPAQIGDAESTGGAGADVEVTANGSGNLDAYREEAGLSPLNATTGAQLAARRHATDMAANGFFAHEGSDGSTFADRLEAEGCTGVLSENIAKGDFTRSSVIEAWMDSPPHRANILRPEVSVYGLVKVDTSWVMTLAGEC